MTETEVRAIYEEYLEAAAEAEVERKPGDGLLGIGKGPADSPCHTRFAGALEAKLNAFAVSVPESAAIAAVLDYIYGVAPKYEDLKSAYWMLLAVHGLTLPLIPRLSPADAARLRARYAETYPRWKRLPVQNQVLAALKSAAK